MKNRFSTWLKPFQVFYFHHTTYPAHINLLLHIETQYYFEENPELEIMDNLTAILYKTDDIRMEQTPIPTPGKIMARKCIWILILSGAK